MLFDKFFSKKKKKEYRLEYVKSFMDQERTYEIGEHRTYHDVVMGKWRLTIQLDKNFYYFLSVFVLEDGTFEKYSLDIEAASDSHYEFSDEAKIREQIYMEGDEGRYFDEILIRYLSQHGGQALLKLIWPYVTAQYHFD